MSVSVLRKAIAPAMLATAIFGGSAMGQETEGPFKDQAGAKSSGAVLSRLCDPIRGPNNTIDNDRLSECLSGLRGETRKMHQAHAAFYALSGPGRRQDSFVAGIASDILGQCSPLYESYDAAGKSAKDVTLDITGQVNNCLNALRDTGNLKTIKMPFDKARFVVIAAVNNCGVRRLTGAADAVAWCKEALGTPKAP